MKLKHILILQNKIDLVKESQAKEQYEQILAFVQGKFSKAEIQLVVEIQCWDIDIVVFCMFIEKLLWDNAGVHGLLMWKSDPWSCASCLFQPACIQ